MLKNEPPNLSDRKYLYPLIILEIAYVKQDQTARTQSPLLKIATEEQKSTVSTLTNAGDKKLTFESTQPSVAIIHYHSSRTRTFIWF